MLYFDVLWRHWQVGRDSRGLYFSRIECGPQRLHGYFEACLGALRVRYN